MEKQKIVKLFLEKGYQLDPELLDYLFNNQEHVEFLLEKLSSYKGKSVLTLETVKSIKPDRVTVLRSYKKQPKKISVDDVNSLLKNRYEKLSQILLRRLELVRVISINRITQKLRNFSVIGLVRSKDEGKHSLLVEDNTGEAEVFFDEGSKKEFNSILLDDVLGLVCEAEGGRIFVKKVIYPDIPFKKEVSKTEEDVYCLFLSNVCMDSEKFDKKHFKKFLDWVKDWNKRNLLIFVVGGISSKPEDVEEFLKKVSYEQTYLLRSKDDAEHDVFAFEDPALIKIDGLTIFLSHGDVIGKYVEQLKTPVEQTCLLLLKKRHLNPTVELPEVYPEDDYFLERVPDIIVCGTSKNPTFLNYKGTTIVSCGNFIDIPIFWLINLKTREIFKIDFT